MAALLEPQCELCGEEVVAIRVIGVLSSCEAVLEFGLRMSAEVMAEPTLQSRLSSIPCGQARYGWQPWEYTAQLPASLETGFCGHDNAPRNYDQKTPKKQTRD